MRNLMHRIDRLEEMTAQQHAQPPRMLIRFIDLVKDGAAPAPWNPTSAEVIGAGRIDREAGETVEAFESRAAERFPVGICLMV